MLFINPQGDYPRHIGDIQIDHPDFKNEDALPQGWLLVEPTPYPELGVDEVAEELPPEQIGESDLYKQTWNVRPLTSEELAYRNAPATAKAKLLALGLTEVEINALSTGLLR